MSCNGVKIEEPRNADLRRTYTPQRGFSFAGFTAQMQVRTHEGAPDPALLDIGMAATVNGSAFSVVGETMVLTIKREDLETLPEADPVSDPAYFVYDILMIDQTGFVNKFLSGPFVMTKGVTR